MEVSDRSLSAAGRETQVIFQMQNNTSEKRGQRHYLKHKVLLDIKEKKSEIWSHNELSLSLYWLRDI